MKYTAFEIADKLNGSVLGNGKVVVNALAKIEHAQPGSLSFLAHPKYIPFLSDTQASIVLVAKDFTLKHASKATLIQVENPYHAFTFLLQEFAKEKKKNLHGIHPSALIDPSASIATDVYIGPNVTIGANTSIAERVRIHGHCYIGSEVTIGKDSEIHPRVSVLDESEIGANCIIQSGAVIGCEGFGFAPQKEGNQVKIPQLGKVIVEDDVEIGANTTIDRATLGATVIRQGVKLDNLVQIAHNVEIGPHTVIAAQSGVAGSSKIGARCVIGGQVGIIGHLNLGDDIQIQGQTGVISNIPNGQVIQGTPAIDFKSFYKSYALFKQLPDFESRLKKLEKTNTHDR
jgi:UDP-3-O-[3-hydroxymyristoyl] glucosamine N-acyltransferase